MRIVSVLLEHFWNDFTHKIWVKLVSGDFAARKIKSDISCENIGNNVCFKGVGSIFWLAFCRVSPIGWFVSYLGIKCLSIAVRTGPRTLLSAFLNIEFTVKASISSHLDATRYTTRSRFNSCLVYGAMRCGCAYILVKILWTWRYTPQVLE